MDRVTVREVWGFTDIYQQNIDSLGFLHFPFDIIEHKQLTL